MSTSASVSSHLSAHLTAKGLYPTQSWLQSFLETQRLTTPLPALKQTTLFRLLSTDIVTALERTPSTNFPSDILNVSIAQRRLAGPIAVQILSVEDIGHSRWSQLETFEAADRGETTKGREVIRVVAGEEGLSDPEAGSKGGPHKLVLQDSKGTRVFGFELAGIGGVSTGMTMGAKMVLRDVVVARGLVMLEPKTVTLLGGKVDTVDTLWKEQRKARLHAAVHPTDGTESAT